ncbi:glycosyltransferase family 2 protein [Agrococcus sp. Ld7]|uniref:glycosyltransferase family 2 protein n=1 Tax=Agrococcus sp. Ld7 TaxID=649148 RepID=UPI00386E2FAB
MTVVLTLMVRDEADIIAAMLEHHLAHGVDHILVTDNASVDGTREILADYARIAPVTVFDDPVHRKQQAEVVTRMARLAATEHGADWVINGDADEFLRPLDPTMTLAEVFQRLPAAVGAFQVPVVNMVGPFARRGSGIRRLTYRDLRTEDQLRASGLVAHPSSNAIHIGDPEVEVVQGNHRVSTPAGEQPASELALEVLHLPWRSMEQIERKIRNMGEGYDANPQLQPSPRHHGMRDWRRMRAGLLAAFVAWRMPTDDELHEPEYGADASLAASLDALPGLLPDRLEAALADSADEPFDDAMLHAERARAAAAEPLERLALEELTNARLDADALRVDRDRLDAQLTFTRAHADTLQRDLDAAQAVLEQLRARTAMLERSPSQRVVGVARRAIGRLGGG